MEQWTWNKSMSVGNAFLDADHKKLLGMIEEVERAIAANELEDAEGGLLQLTRSTDPEIGRRAVEETSGGLPVAHSRRQRAGGVQLASAGGVVAPHGITSSQVALSTL